MNYSQVVVVQDWLNSQQMRDDNIFVVIVFAGCCFRGGEREESKMSLVKRLFRILILLSILSLFIHILTLFTASGKKELQRSDEVLAVKRFLIYSKGKAGLILLMVFTTVHADIMKNRGHMVESMEEIPDTLMGKYIHYKFE